VHSIIVGVTAALLTAACSQLLPMGWIARWLIASVFLVHSGLFNEGISFNSEHLANLFCVSFLVCWLHGHSSKSSLLRCVAFLLLALAVSVKKQLIPMIFCAPAFWYLSDAIEHKAKRFVTEMAGSATCFLLPHIVFSILFAQRVGGADSASLEYFVTSPYQPFGFIATFAQRIFDDPLILPASLIAGTVITIQLIRLFTGPSSDAPLSLKIASFYFLFSILSVVPGLRLWSHYYMLVAPASLLVLVAAIHPVLKSKLVGMPEICISSALWGCLFIPKIIMSYDVAIDVELRQTAQWINEHSDYDDQVFVWGWQPELYVLSQRVPATRFAATNYIVNDIQAISTMPLFDAGRLEELLADLEDSRPSLLVIVRQNFYTLDNERYDVDRIPKLREYLVENFDGMPILNNPRFSIFARKSDK
jgi:hypothetical protein